VAPKDVVVKARRTKTFSNKLDDHQWRVLKRKHKAHSKSRNLPCWYAAYGRCVLDGAPIDYNAAPQTPYAYETDHYRARSTHPHLKYVWNNLRASHCRCNRTHQAKGKAVVAQQDWVKPSW
jgi:hypothetical protein